MATSAPLSPEVEAVIPVRALSMFQRRWGWLLVLGILQLLGGALALVVPVIASLAAAIVFGAVLFVAGIFQLVHAFSLKGWKGVALHVLGGLLYVAAGVFIALFPPVGALTLAIIIGAFLIADGVVRLVLASRLRPREGWGWLLAAGIAGTVLGIMLLVGWPFTGLWAVGILLGVDLIFSGVAYCALAIEFRTRSAREAQRDSLEHARPHA